MFYPAKILNYLLAWFLRYSFTSFCHHGNGGAAVDLSFKHEHPYLSHVKILSQSVSEIFTNLLAEDTLRKSSSSMTSWSIRKLQMLIIVKNMHIFCFVKILN
jgi:hypothetical protein